MSTCSGVRQREGSDLEGGGETSSSTDRTRDGGGGPLLVDFIAGAELAIMRLG